ncbi:hypothetical protein ACAG39_07735 [Caldicellulosiruptoraceae bacterium PP1]
MKRINIEKNKITSDIFKLLVIMFSILILLTVIINYTIRKSNIKKEIELNLNNSIKNQTKIIESKLISYTDVLNSFTLNRDLINYIFLSKSERYKTENKALSNLLEENLKNTAKQVSGLVYMLSRNGEEFLFSSSNKLVFNKDTISKLKLIGEIEGDMPVSVYLLNKNIVLSSDILNIVSLTKVGKIYLLIDTDKYIYQSNIIKNQYRLSGIEISAKNNLLYNSKFKGKGYIIKEDMFLNNMFSVKYYISKAEVYKKEYLLIYLYIFITIISLLFIIITAYQTGIFFNNRLKNLNNIINLVKNKDLQVKPIVDDKEDEVIKNLYNSFYKIILELKNQIKSLYEISISKEFKISSINEFIVENNKYQLMLQNLIEATVENAEKNKNNNLEIVELLNNYSIKSNDIENMVDEQILIMEELNSFITRMELNIKNKLDSFSNFNKIIDTILLISVYAKKEIMKLIKLFNKLTDNINTLKFISVSIKIELENSKMKEQLSTLTAIGSFAETINNKLIEYNKLTNNLYQNIYELDKDIEDIKKQSYTEIKFLNNTLYKLKEIMVDISNISEISKNINQQIKDYLDKLELLKNKFLEGVRFSDRIKKEVDDIANKSEQIKEGITIIGNNASIMNNHIANINNYISSFKL